MTTEDRLLYFQKEVIRCIKEPTVVSRLLADTVLSQADSSRLKDLYRRGDCSKANEEMIDCLIKSKKRGKWRSFLDALEQSDYHYLKLLLESTSRPRETDERSREIIRVFSPYLEKTISAKDIVTELYSRDVINNIDQEEILATYQNKGDTYATIFLLERMQCRLHPDEWYFQFLSTLVETGLDYVVKEIEPDFLSCPEQFKPSMKQLPQTEILEYASPSVSNLKSCTTMETQSATMCDTEHWEAGCTSSEDVIEHMLTDHVEAGEDMGDQGVPVPEEAQNSDEGSSINTSQVSSVQDNHHPPFADTTKLVSGTVDEPRVSSYHRFEKDVTEAGSSGHDLCGSTERNKTGITAGPGILEKLGERRPPEGQDRDVSSSCDIFAVPATENNNDILENSIKTKENTLGKSDVFPSGTAVKEEERSDMQRTATDSDILDTDISDTDAGDEGDERPLSEKLYTFQLELAEKALAGRNTIICAPTGSGKTWVALYITDNHLKSNRGNKKVAFMARNGVLVKQQVDRFSTELTYARVKHLIGDTEDSSMLQAFLEDYDIFFFTPQILVNNLNTDVKSLAAFSLLIFDECHHTRGEEPYNMLMRHYHLEKSQGVKGLPQIVGLTASIGTGRAKSEKDALDHIFRLCARLDVRCLSLVEKNKVDLAEHVSLPSEEIIPMKKRDTDPCRAILLEAIRDTQDILSEEASMSLCMLKQMHNRPKEIESKKYGVWTAEIIKLSETLVGGQGRDIASCARYLQVYHNALEVNRLLRTEDIAMYLAEQHQLEVEQQDTLTQKETQILQRLRDVQKDLMKVTVNNPNVEVLCQLLIILFSSEDVDSRAMIFVHARATSRALADYLNEKLADIYVEVSPFLGKDKRGTDKGMTEEEQTDVINNFRDGKFKVLVATSVGMEGLDVPDCNMILNYNFTGDDITKIQMPGRSRKKGGKSVMIATDDQVEKDKIAMYRIKLMTIAIEEFKKLDANSVNRQILTIQKTELDDYKWHLKTRDLKRSKQTDDTDYEIQCRKCGKFVCNASDVRELKTSHLVAVRDFEEKIQKKEHSKRANIGPIKKKFKMYCRNCPNDWGVIGEKDGVDFYVLKCESLKFVSSRDTESVNTYKKWTDVPYKFNPISDKDLDHMYDEVM